MMETMVERDGKSLPRNPTFDVNEDLHGHPFGKFLIDQARNSFAANRRRSAVNSSPDEEWRFTIGIERADYGDKVWINLSVGEGYMKSYYTPKDGMLGSIPTPLDEEQKSFFIGLVTRHYPDLKFPTEVDPLSNLSLPEAPLSVVDRVLGFLLR